MIAFDRNVSVINIAVNRLNFTVFINGRRYRLQRFLRAVRSKNYQTACFSVIKELNAVIRNLLIISVRGKDI